jgi:chromosome segregation ATPase
VERARLEMQLVVACVVAAAAVVSEATTRTTLEAAKQSAEDCATEAQAAAATTTMERDALATRLAQAGAEIKRLRAAAMTANEGVEKSTTAFATAEAATRDAAQTAAQEKTTLDAMVEELEWDLTTAGVDLSTAIYQFSEVTNRLQVVSEEATWLREDNSKL